MFKLFAAIKAITTIFQNLTIVNAVGSSSYLIRKHNYFGTRFAASTVILLFFLVDCIEIMIKILYTT